MRFLLPKQQIPVLLAFALALALALMACETPVVDCCCCSLTGAADVECAVWSSDELGGTAANQCGEETSWPEDFMSCGTDSLELDLPNSLRAAGDQCLGQLE